MRQLGPCDDFTGVVLSRQRLSTSVCVETASNVVAQFWHSMQAKILLLDSFCKKRKYYNYQDKEVKLGQKIVKVCVILITMIFLLFCYDCFDIIKCNNNLTAVNSKQNILIRISLLPIFTHYWLKTSNLKLFNVIFNSAFMSFFRTNYILHELMDDFY